MKIEEVLEDDQENILEVGKAVLFLFLKGEKTHICNICKSQYSTLEYNEDEVVFGEFNL